MALSSTAKASSRCELTSFDRNTSASVNSFRAHEHAEKFIDFCPNNDFLLATANANEIALWDIRNVTKRLFTVKSPGIASMQFLDRYGINFLTTAGNDVKILDLRRADENFEAVS